MWRCAGGRSLRKAAAAASEQAVIARASSGWHLERLLCSTLECRASGSSQARPLVCVHSRGFAAPAADEDGDTEQRVVGNERVQRLAEEVMQLSLLEVSDLTEILTKRLGIAMPTMGGPMMGGMGMAGSAGAPAAGAAPAAEAPPAEAKTEFDIKLTGFDAASKVKVIKEVRTMTSLGLKEAKELVEKAPTIIKSGVKKEEAEELQKKLEAVGGKISLE